MRLVTTLDVVKVIVEFYQPDSEQCKALEPKYEEVRAPKPNTEAS